MKHLLKKESGQGLVEYALIILFVAIALVLSLGSFGTALHAYYDGFVGNF